MNEIRYGDDKTIHRTEHVDVEVDDSGRVVAVWFRCAALQFTQSHAGQDRAKEMRSMYAKNPRPSIKAIIFDD